MICKTCMGTGYIPAPDMDGVEKVQDCPDCKNRKAYVLECQGHRTRFMPGYGYLFCPLRGGELKKVVSD